MGTAVPTPRLGAVVRSDQNVSPTAESTHWCTSCWFDASVRAVALSQSLPTACTHDPSAVVVRLTEGAPVPADPPAVAPIPAAPAKLMTVSDWSKPPDAGVDVTWALVSTPVALAVQISDVPSWPLARFARVHVRPAPETVAVWVPLGP